MDIVLVTYNSSKWIKCCMEAIAASQGLTQALNVFVVDNQSSDDTIVQLEQFSKDKRFTSFTIDKQTQNLGFGKANNAGAMLGKDDIICFINVDTEVFPDTFANLQAEVAASDAHVGAWEMRQIPFEHPKLYDPVTEETSWMSGAAFAVRRSIFETIGGFDPQIFMYAEDVDISWRIRAQGYTLKYCPKVMIRHYSYQKENEVKPTQYLEAIKNNILLKYRYVNWLTVLKGKLMFWQVYFCHQEPFEGAKRQLLQNYKKLRKAAPYFKKTRINDRSIAKFLGWDYELIRDGAFIEVQLPKKQPFVSVIVRTCQRPSVLRETLISIRNQTYPNVEVVVVEDGKPDAKEMIETEFNDLTIQYYATGERKGRSVAGNIGLSMAKGEYINFLDDDDLFYADHIETLVVALQNTDKKAAYSFAFETPVVVHSQEPYEYEVISHIGRHKQSFDKITLSHHNYIPIQCIMFSRELYEKLGGFDETLDYLEDWDLWVRYMQETDYECVPKTTSIYKVPAKKQEQAGRQEKLDEALKTVRKKHEGYYVTVPVSSLVALREESLCQVIAKKFRFSR